MGKLFKDNVGVQFTVDTEIDLSTATVKKLIVKKPSDKYVEWTDTSVVDTTKIRYTTVAIDLDESGEYAIAAYVEFGSTSKHYGETVKFKVYEPLV